MEKINRPRGTYDLYGTDMRIRMKIISDIEQIATAYMYEKIETPTFESLNLFERTVGEFTDIVSKEMYIFEDKKNRTFALRPEATASIARAFVDEKLGAQNPNTRLFYYSSLFRYERPQAGRFRQFYQLGLEHYSEKDFKVDVEVISIVNNIFKHFNIDDKVTLKINSLGNTQDRLKYNDELVSYYSERKEHLCSDCINRLENNVLRLLDCKVCSSNEHVNNPPSILDFLSKESSEYFEKTKEYLNYLNIDFEVDNKLVRGLDYYNDIVFECVLKENGLAICGGGRYDNLISQISNQSSPAFGVGIGVERFVDVVLKFFPELRNEFELSADIYYIPMNEEAQKICFKSMDRLRLEGVRCHMSMDLKSFKNNLKAATKFNCVYAIIIGEDELENNYVTIKNLYSREETKASLEEFENDILEGEAHE